MKMNKMKSLKKNIKLSFQGLNEFIDDKEILDFYLDLIYEMIIDETKSLQQKLDKAESINFRQQKLK